MMAAGDNLHLFVLFFLTLAPCLRSSVSHQDLPRGHGEQLGKHRESEGHVDVIDSSELPSPQRFWDQYASTANLWYFAEQGNIFLLSNCGRMNI